jgi:hypothetical protein
LEFKSLPQLAPAGIYIPLHAFHSSNLALTLHLLSCRWIVERDTHNGAGWEIEDAKVSHVSAPLSPLISVFLFQKLVPGMAFPPFTDYQEAFYSPLSTSILQ